MAERRIKTSERPQILVAVAALTVCALIAAVVEVCVFNVSWLTSLASGGAVTLSAIGEGDDQEILGKTLTISNVDTAVSSMSIQFSDDEWHDITVYAMDQSSSEYRWIGDLHVSGDPLYFHSQGKTLSIRLYADDKPAQIIDSITLNGSTMIEFSAARWGLIALLLFALWLARPRSGWWTRRALDCRAVFPACAGVLCCVALVALGLAYNGTVLDGFDLKGLYQYNDLARALASGNVSLDIQPSDELLALSNPYDTASREGIDYMWDYAFYNGKYYSYFGVIPCIVFYLPFYLITGSAMPNLVVSMIALAAFYLGSIYMIRRIVGRWFSQASVMAVVLCAVVLLFGTMSLSLVSLSTIYPVPIACGAACAVWGLALWMRAVEGERVSWTFGLVGSFLGGLTLGCRPQMFLVFLLVLPLFIDAVRKGRAKAWTFFVFIAPIVVVAVLLGAYNFARFGSPLDFGSSYNLTNDDMSKHGYSPYVGALGIFGFLLQPPKVIADWPFVIGVDLSYAQNSDLVIEHTIGGLFAIAPLLLCGFWFLWNKRLQLGQSWVTIAESIIGVVCAFLLAYFDACAGGLILRYQVDMGFFAAIAAYIGILALTTKLLPTSTGDLCAKNDPNAVEGGLQHVFKLGLVALAWLSIVISALYFLGAV